MSFLHQQRQQLQMLPAVWPIQNTGPRKSGYLNGPHNTLDAEAHMAQQARNKIQARLKLAKLFQQYRAQPISNKYGITVNSDPVSTEERIFLTVFEKKKVVLLTVKNSGFAKVFLTFRAFDLVKDIFTVSDCHGHIMKSIKRHSLGPGEAYKIKVHFYSHHAGFYEQLLVFKFETCRQSDTFEIMRLLEIARQTSFNEEVLPTAANSLCDHQTLRWPPAKGSGFMLLKPIVSLKYYTMPDNIKLFRDSHPDLHRPLNWNNYSQRFHLLLHLEEFQQKTDIEKYNQDDVPLFRHKSNTNLFVLQITGVSKGSLLKLSGNQVLVTPLDQKEVKSEIHQGWIYHVDAEQVYLQFSEKFMSDFKDGTRFRVLFAINRIPMRIQHRAVARVYKHGLREVLFPTGKLSSHHLHIHSLLGIEINPEQHMAIQHILAGSAKPSPYLVFGPPGTGKTATLVEAINQIVKTQASCNILACAPSNSATDHLCEKILEGNLGNQLEVYRLYSLSTPVKNVPQNSKLCCNLIYGTNTFMIPPKEELMRYKILVTTLQTAGRLVTGGIPPGHFTYIFVDEAGQAAEPECIIPIAGLLNPQRCQIVLAGDPKQLGPIITSRIAQEHGMGVSLLERLMGDIDLYKSHEAYGFNNRFVTKLLRNYRSHPAILKIPNELFYKGELQPFARKEKCNSFCKWEHLPKKGFPLIFHEVAGSDERDANSPSVYNMAEVEVLKEYLKALVDHICKKRGTKIQPREIGIIAPYRKQVEKIQKALEMDKDLEKENLENILVGSVEQFQGKEFNVILMSTVRSTPKLTAHKQRFTIGFLDNEKRFNVALTRARALLIVVGDPRVLKTDQIWNKFIHYCYKEGGYRGITVSDGEEEDAPTNAHLSHRCGE